MRYCYKALKVLYSFLLSMRFLFLSLFSKENLEDGNPELIVSLTSYGKRLNYVFLTIESIFQQEYKPKEIVLWLHESERKRALSNFFIQRQIKRGLVVRFLQEDYKSYKKLSYIYKYITQYNFDFFVTADDDVFYPNYWLLSFSKIYQKNKKIVLCYRARDIIFDENQDIIPYVNWPLSKGGARNGIIPTGVSGICYPKESLDSRVYDFDAISKNCPSADDIWYKLIAASNGFKSCLIVENSIHFIPIITGFTKGLEKINVLNDRNTIQFINSMKYLNVSYIDLCDKNEEV